MAWSITFEIRGREFRPSLIDLNFQRQHDVGVLGTRGRYKGLPYPYGSASYLAPSDLAHNLRIPHIAKVFVPRLDQLRRAGAEDWHVSIGRYYSAQCNEEFEAAELTALVELGCSLTYSAYQVDELEEERLAKEFGYP